MGAHEFHGTASSRAGRLESKLGPGVVTLDRLIELLKARATPGPPPDLGLEPWPEHDEGGEA